MHVLMLCLALLLIAGGGSALFLGFDIVVTDRGLAMVLAGVTALSAGVVALGLAFLLKTAGDIAAAMAERPARPSPPPRQARPVVPLADEVAPVRESPATAVAVTVAAAAAVAAAAVPASATRTVDPDESKLPLPEPPAERPAPSVAAFEEALQRALLEETPAVPAAAAPAVAVEPVVAALPQAAEGLEDAAIFVDEPVRPPADPPSLAWPEEVLPPESAAVPEPPAVVGRYAAGGREYVMFADGSVETGNGETRRRFPSLEDLRRHLAEARA